MCPSAPAPGPPPRRLQPRSLFAPVCGLLFQKLPPRTAARAVGQLARFVLGSSLPGVAAELGVMASQAACYAPAAAERELLLPLLGRLEAELADMPPGACVCACACARVCECGGGGGGRQLMHHT